MRHVSPNLEAIFTEAADLPESARSDYLSRACGDDSTLRGEVERLLAQGTLPGTSMLREAAGLALLTTPAEVLPIELERYRLEARIGQGAFGVVYRAVQQSPVTRTVAVKVLRPGLDSPDIVRRFESERQVLAAMDHINISSLFDAGNTPEGRPFFVMELLDGQPLTRYCDERRLDVRQRVGLFLNVCAGVEHAHRKGVLHRDLKPSNILVVEKEGRALVKVIDFGIARALVDSGLSGGMSARGLTMEMGRPVGTPEYMSPEQFNADPARIDGRSDIYSLGVVLYELLSGCTPLDREPLMEGGLGAVRQRVLSFEPSPPSSRVDASDPATRAARAADRGVDPPRLSRAIRGDLDWIALKCLEKDRADRYETAFDLAADLRRFLDFEPVEARPRNAGYRLRKFIRRNRAALAIVSAATLLISMAVGFYIRSIRAEQRKTEAALVTANDQRRIADAENKFLTDMLSSADPYKLMGDKVTVLQATQAAITRLDDGAFKNQPLAEAAVRLTIGDTLRDLSHLDEAERNLRIALDIHHKILNPDHPQIVIDLTKLGWLLELEHRHADAEKVFREALLSHRKEFPVDDVNTADLVNSLASSLLSEGKTNEAEPLFREALALRRKTLHADDLSVASSLSGLASVLQLNGSLDDAETYRRQALKITRSVFPENHPDVAGSLTQLGSLLLREMKFKEAAATYQESLDIRRRVLPADHPDIAVSINGLEAVKRNEENSVEDETLLRESLERLRKSAPDGNMDTAQALSELGATLRQEDKFAAAEPYFEESLAIRRRLLPADDVTIGHSLNELADVRLYMGHYREAEPLFREALVIFRKAYSGGHRDLAWSLGGLGNILRTNGRLTEADPLLVDALDMIRKLLPANDPIVAVNIMMLAELRDAQHRFADAETLYRQSLAIRRGVLSANHPDVISNVYRLGLVLYSQGERADAEPLFEEAYHLVPESRMDPKYGAICMTGYGVVLADMNRYDDALAPLLEARQRLEMTQQISSRSMLGVVSALVKSCEQSNRPDDAARWKSELLSLQKAARSDRQMKNTATASRPAN